MSSFLVSVQRYRSRQFTVTLYEDDDVTPSDLETGDIALVRVGYDGQTVLEIRSDEVSDGDSTITFSDGDNVLTVRFGAVDTGELELPVYECEVLVIDQSDSSRIKTCETGVLHVGGTFPEPAALQSSSSS